MNWIISFIVGILVGQEVQNIPRVKPIISNGFVKTMEYLKKIETNEKQSKSSYFDYIYYFQKNDNKKE